jgi:hypothetical protein
MEITVTDNKLLKDILSKAAIGDSFIITRSTLSKDSINYEEYLFNLQASMLKGDCRREPNGDWHYKMTFVEKQDFTHPGYGIIFNYGFDSTEVFRVSESKLPYIVKPKVVALSIAKGNRVRFDESLEGIITKYSSNASIEITMDDNTKQIISKDRIYAKC